MPAIPNLSNWQANMTNYGQQVCNYLDTPGLTFNQRFPWIYYDQIRVMYQISDYVPASASYWNACALKARGVYRDEYVFPQNGGAAGNQIFTTGLRMDYERTGDVQSKNAALLLSQNASFSTDTTPWNYLIDAAFSRETAYVILAKLDAEKLGSATSPRLGPLVDIALGHMDQWVVSKSFRCVIPGGCPSSAVGQYYIQPFMVGLTMRALIVYYEKTADPRIPPMIKTAADWLWANAWMANDQTFWLENWVPNPSQAFPPGVVADDINLLIVPAYAWLYRQTGDATYQSRGDQIFSGGVLGAVDMGTLGQGKQFDQNYIWSFDYVKWRTVSSSSTQPVTWTEVSNAAPESDGGIISTTVNTMASAVTVQQLTDGNYWEFVPNNVTAETQYRINTVGNRNVYRRLAFGGGYVSFYDTSGTWQGQTTVTSSSVLKISLEGTTLKIYKDGNSTPVYTFTDTLNAPLEMQMFFWVSSANVGAGLTSAVVNSATPSTQPVTWTEVSNAATESDGGITSTTVNTMASAVTVQQLTSGKYWEMIPNHVSGGPSSEFRINTVGNRTVYRRLVFGLGYLTFYDSAGVWQGQTTVTTSSVIKISLEGTTLKIYKDGNPTTVYTFTDTLNAPLEMQMFYWVTSANVGAGMTSAVVNSATPSTQSVTWTEVSNAATESDGGITSTTVNTMASAVTVQQLTAGKYWEFIPNNVTAESQYRINTVGNRNVYRRLAFGGGYLSFYDTSGTWQGQTTVTSSSVLKISLEGTTLKIYKDGNPTPVYIFTDTLNAPLEMQMFYWVTSSNVGAGLTSAIIN